MTLNPFNCTIRVFDPNDDATIAEHAAASTLANAASFTTKTGFGGSVKSVAFSCTEVEPRA